MSHAAQRRPDPANRAQEFERRGADRPWSGKSPDAGAEHPPVESAPELTSFIESASEAVIAVSPEGTITSWSDGAQRLFGYAREEIVGRIVLGLSPPDLAAGARELLAAMQAGKPVQRQDTERLTKDGRRLRLRISMSPIWSHDGTFAGAVAIYSDLSEQRRTEEALRASERRYHSVVEALVEGVVMRDADGRVVASNKSAERILGLKSDELHRTTQKQPPVSLIHEDGSPFLHDELPTVVSMRSGVAQRGILMGVDRADGPIRWMSMNTSAVIHPGAQAPYPTVASFADVTELRETLAELHAARLGDLARLALMGEYRDDDTNRHTERVAHTVELLASSLGLGGDFISTITSAAPLHDVGKIGIPDSILLKPGKLTADEFEVIKTHTVIGGRILSNSNVPILRMATSIAFTHHERWDGTGYPAGLRELEIPVAGRIVAVADAFDAMTHARPYKTALSVEHAVEEIKRCSGTQFDPQIVEAFMTLDHNELVERA
jgi:putative two-component system response regulator